MASFHRKYSSHPWSQQTALIQFTRKTSQYFKFSCWLCNFHLIAGGCHLCSNLGIYVSIEEVNIYQRLSDIERCIYQTTHMKFKNVLSKLILMASPCAAVKTYADASDMLEEHLCHLQRIQMNTFTSPAKTNVLLWLMCNVVLSLLTRQNKKNRMVFFLW